MRQEDGDRVWMPPACQEQRVPELSKEGFGHAGHRTSPFMRGSVPGQGAWKGKLRGRLPWSDEEVLYVRLPA